jgi:hypothetical protein
MYTALDGDDDATTATGSTTTTLNVAAMTTEGSLMGAHTTAVSKSIANVINQLSANQTALMMHINQIAAMSLGQRPQAPSFQTTHAPPIQQFAILAEQQQEGDTAEETGATDVADAAQDAEEDKINVRHLLPTNRDEDTERAGSYRKDRQDLSRRHCLGVTINQQHPCSIL